MFGIHLNCFCLVLSQNCGAINQLVILQKKLLELLTFSHLTLTLVLYSKKRFILKSSDKVSLENNLFFSKSINNLLPSLFNNQTSTIMKLLGLTLAIFINIYGFKSAINVWNNSQKYLKFLSDICLLIKSKNSVRYLFCKVLK